MSTMTKVFVVLTSVVAIVLSCLTIATAAQWSNTREDIQRFKELADAAIVLRGQTQAVMATSLAIKDDAIQERDRLLAGKQEEIRRFTDELNDLRTELARVTNEKVTAEADRKKLQEILDVQVAELTSTQKQNQVLVTQNIDLQTRNQRLSARLLEVTGNLTIATDQNRNLQEKLYAAEQRSKALQQQLASGRRAVPREKTPDGVVAVSPLVAGPIRGEISQVDGRYVSIDVGASSGVVAGMTFMIYRGGTYIGDLEIDMVRPKESGGQITMLAAGQQVGRGDRVAYGLEPR